MKFKKLGTKISLLVVAINFALIACVLAIVVNRTTALANNLTLNQSIAATRSFEMAIEEYKTIVFEKAGQLAQLSGIINATTENSEESLKEEIIIGSVGLDYVTVCDLSGKTIASTHGVGKGEDISQQKVIQNVIQNGVGTSAIESGTIIPIAARGSAPIKDEKGKTIAILSCGLNLSNAEYVDKIKTQSNCEATIFLEDIRVSTTIMNEKNERVIGTAAAPHVTKSVIDGKQNYMGRVELFTKQYEVCYAPLIESGKVIGMLFTGVNIDAVLADQRTMLTLTIGASALLLILSVFMIQLVTKLLITRPLAKISNFAELIEQGYIGLSPNNNGSIDIKAKDEVGMLARTLENTCLQLKGYVSEISTRMKHLANGDFTRPAEYDFQGDFTNIKQSIYTITSSLSGTMSEIRTVASQVSSESLQVSNVSQTVAQNSTEQAGTIEELTATINEVTSKSVQSQEESTQALGHVNDAKELIISTASQMKELSEAMNNINEASQGILRINKAIDDIAFQTNLLALNAAVEAARAGEHGKGFGVVADEVRALASKSAGSAKQTDELIQNTIVAVKKGAEIAKNAFETIEKTSRSSIEAAELMTSVEKIVGEQSASISQINSGMQLIVETIQENTANSEMGSATSQELLVQANILNSRVSKFKI